MRQTTAFFRRTTLKLLACVLFCLADRGAAHAEAQSSMPIAPEVQPAGAQQILLVPRNIVDGKLNAIGVGMEPSVPAKP